MIKVLEICDQLGLGGTEKVMHTFCKYLDRTKFTVFSCGLFAGGVREDFFHQLSDGLLLAEGDMGKVKDFISKENINILHWHNINLTKNDRYPKILELLEFCKQKGVFIIETSPFSNFDPAIDRFINLRLFVSKINVLKFFVKYKIPQNQQDKYQFLYNPLDTEELNKLVCNKEERKQLRSQLGIKEDDFVIGKVGRADLWKWDDKIIELVPRLLPQIPNLKVVIRALPPQRLTQIQPWKSHFVILPETSSEKEIMDTFHVMDLLYHTSRIGECNSVAINEALFFGLPVITDSTDFMKPCLYDRDNGQIEIVRDGVNGFVLNDLSETVEKIVLLSKDQGLRRIIGENNKKKAEELYSASKITKVLEGVFENKRFSSERISLEQYQLLAKKENLFHLAKINLSAIIDKFNL